MWNSYLNRGIMEDYWNMAHSCDLMSCFMLRLRRGEILHLLNTVDDIIRILEVASFLNDGGGGCKASLMQSAAS